MKNIEDKDRAAMARQLRETCLSIRRQPYPISDIIPQLQKAADLLDTPKPHPKNVVVPIELLRDINDRVSTLAILSLEADRYIIGHAINQDISDLISGRHHYQGLS